MTFRDSSSRRCRDWRFFTRLLFLITGLLSFAWFIIRVIPKPSRATYPCMRVAAPLASGFVVYLLSLITSAAVYRKARKSFKESHYAIGAFFVVIAMFTGGWMLAQTHNSARASWHAVPQPSNDPIGEAQGINPGRVVWVWDPDATNENCTLEYNGDGQAEENDDGYFLDKNNDQAIIDRMVSKSLISLTGESTAEESWDALFVYFNFRKYGLEDTGYTEGEKIFIKINATSTWPGNITENYDQVENDHYCVAETSPQIVLSTLRQLVNIYGVPEDDIYVGDPMRLLYNHCYDKWDAEFPNVHYIAHEEGGGREGVIRGTEPSIFYSDAGTVLDVTSDTVYTVLEDADYIINIPALKAHARAGITLFAKNHFGSHTRSSASHLHPGLVDPGGGLPIRPDMGMYRTQVDLMGHEMIGQNTVLFLLDGLWAGSGAIDPPTKWTTPPFNDDWTSSIFASQDPVAIESVALDFLKAEYNGEDGKVDYPNMPGVDDYLHQAADSTWWPDDIIYDPEGDGTPIPGLGVHEHWNNTLDKQYSRNLGTGDGIELIFIQDVGDIPPHNAVPYPTVSFGDLRVSGAQTPDGPD